MSHLPEIVIAAALTFAAIWLPGAAVIQAMGLARRPGARRRPAPIRIGHPMGDF